MADSMSIGSSTSGVDYTKWKKLTPEEIIKEQSNGEDIPSEIVAWAEQVAAFAQIPDDVTYEEVHGDVGLDALERLGISPEEEAPLTENAEQPVETEEPDAVQDPARASEAPPEEDNPFAKPVPGQADAKKPAQKAEDKDKDVFTLADNSLTADSEEIRKRKERKGLV